MNDFDATDLMQQPDLPTEIGREYFDHLKKINDVFYDQVKISDQKAAYIFTFMLALLVSSNEGRQVFTLTRYTQGTFFAAFASACLAFSSIFSIISAILVVLPRHVGKSTSLFWGTWNTQKEGFTSAAHRNDKEYLFQQYMENADALAIIARSKYKCVKYAFRGLVVTVLSYIFLLIVT